MNRKRKRNHNNDENPCKPCSLSPGKDCPFKRKDLKINITKEWLKSQFSGPVRPNISQCQETVIAQRYRYFKVFNTFATFERRITCLVWHPKERMIITGSKGGELALYSVADDLWVNQVREWEGGGPGHSILDCTFPDFLCNKALIASLDGTISVRDLERGNGPEERTNILQKDDYNDWYCSVGASCKYGTVLAGDNKGRVVLMDRNLKPTQTVLKAHKGKVNTINFDSSEKIFATASNDHLVKIWDTRQIKNPVHEMMHNKAVNSAYFRGPCLLTTDQGSELRIFTAPTWHYQRILHPHRQFQHLTPIQAVWHPLADLALVGRYPDPKMKEIGDIRTVDVISATTGQFVAELHSAMVPGITSLVCSDPNGNVLACATGRLLVMWKFFDPLSDKMDFGKRAQVSPPTSAPKRKRGSK